LTLAAQTQRGLKALKGSGTLMERCMAAGLPVGSSCSGRGACGRCLMTILRGAELLSAPEAHERESLLRLGASPDQRLGCQCSPLGEEGDLLLATGYW
jgi:ferredoxin